MTDWFVRNWIVLLFAILVVYGIASAGINDADSCRDRKANRVLSREIMGLQREQSGSTRGSAQVFHRYDSDSRVRAFFAQERGKRTNINARVRHLLSANPPIDCDSSWP